MATPSTSQNTLIIIRTKILRLKKYTMENVIKIINALYKNTSGVPIIYAPASMTECLEIASITKFKMHARSA